MIFVKAHAYGNDFLLLDGRMLPKGVDRAALTRAVCDRHRGIGADGLIVYTVPDGHKAAPRTTPVRMSLLNSDGSYSEVSGNGVRCLAAALARMTNAQAGDEVLIETDAGEKRLTLLDRAALVFRAAMGQPEDISMTTLQVDGAAVDAVTLRVGNPQCVVLGEVTQDRLNGLAASLAVHPHFPQGTNVELATVVDPVQVRILIWERGVGPTHASGTGACAAAVAAMQFGGAARDVQVISPGGTQRVEWTDDGLFLTGAAEIIAFCEWRRPVPADA